MEMIKTSLYTTLFLLKTKSNFVFEPLSGISPSPPVSVDICVSVCNLLPFNVSMSCHYWQTCSL